MENKINICPICEKEITRKPSYWKRLKGLATCSKSCRAEYLKTIYLGNNNPNSKYKDTYDAFFQQKHTRVKHTAQQRDIEYNLNPNFLKTLYEQQNGLCYYTSIPMQLSSTDNWNHKNQADFDILSIDRVDSDIGYLENNVVLCCTGINKAKGNIDNNKFQEFINYLVLKQSFSDQIKIKKIRPNATLPMKMGMGNSGYDISAAYIEDCGSYIKVFTGISAQCPVGTYLELYPRSSIYKKGLNLANSIGVIDNSYRGEIIAIFNKLDKYVPIDIGERIGQLIPRQYKVAKFVEVEELDETQRGEGGFGSTDAKTKV